MDAQSYGGGPSSSTSSYHHRTPSNAQHQHGQHASPSLSASINSGGYPHGTSKMNREDTDVVVQAIDRLGNKVGSQLSSLSVQLSSMISIMSQLVESNQQLSRSRFAHKQASDPSSSWPNQQQQHAASSNAPQLNTTQRHPIIRRDSANVFAFDPALDQDATSSFHPNPVRHDLPAPPHTADSAVNVTAAVPNTNGVGMYLASSDTTSEPHHSRQVSGAQFSNQDSHHSHHLPSHLVPIPPAPPQHLHSALEDAGMLSHSLSFDQAGAAGHGMDTDAVDTSPRRPASAYGSVRPFTAVDHSHRPAAPPPIPPQHPQPIHAPHLSGMQGDNNHSGDDQRAMDVKFEMQSDQDQAHYTASGSAGPGGSLDFGRPPTRNPTHRHPMDVMGGDSADHPHDNDGHYHYSHNESFPGQASFSSYDQHHSSPKPSLLAIAGEDGHSPRRVNRPSGGPGMSSGLSRNKSISRETPFGSGGLPRMDSQTAGFPGSPSSNDSGATIGASGDYRMWANAPPPVPETKLRELPEPKWKTLQSARLDLQRKTGRTMAKLGRLPLKDYLEVSQPEYLAARKTGRAAYNDWLQPLVRLAKQDGERVRACTNLIEYSHPMLSLCEGSFKARQLLQQIIDNAIDESTNAKKKSGGSQSQQNHSQRSGGPVPPSEGGGSYERGDTPDDSTDGPHSGFSSSPTVIPESNGSSAYYTRGPGGGDSNESGPLEQSPSVGTDVKATTNGYTTTSGSAASPGVLRSNSNHTNHGNASSTPLVGAGAMRNLPGQIGRFASPRSLTRGMHRVEPYPISSSAKDR